MYCIVCLYQYCRYSIIKGDSIDRFNPVTFLCLVHCTWIFIGIWRHICLVQWFGLIYRWSCVDIGHCEPSRFKLSFHISPFHVCQENNLFFASAWFTFINPCALHSYFVSGQVREWLHILFSPFHMHRFHIE